MPKPLRVALLIETSRSYARNLLAGIAAYARVHGPWTFYYEEERVLGEPVPTGLTAWRPHGIIARIADNRMARQIRRLGLPAVDVLRAMEMSGIPSVIPDQEAIVRLAAEHLLERRLKHFAYCGFPKVLFSEKCRRRFVEILAASGHSVDVFEHRRPMQATGLAQIEKEVLLRERELVAWLRKLPKPVGILACNDTRAYQVLSVCRQHRILVPDQVAVIGVGNGALECELCDPPLSSVDNNGRRAGYEAATLLHRMIEGRDPAPNMTLIEPIGVVTRRSTDVLAIANQDLVEIIRDVRNLACEGLTPTGLAERSSVSRSTLERWFVKHLGHSVNDEILHVRLDRVKELLTTSDLPLAEIARLSGFAHPETMQRLFKNAVGQTPGRYRASRQAAGAAALTYGV